jgi:hypothetical protein
MDESRAADLRRLDALIRDPNTSTTRRLQLENNKQAILIQLKDPRTVQLRQQLIGASKAGDTEAVSKVTEELKISDQRQGFDHYKR